MRISPKRAGWPACASPCFRAALLLLAAIYTACSTSTESAQHTVALDFGSVRVGQRATRSVTLGLATPQRSLSLQFAPDDFTVPARIELSGEEESTVEVTWTPRAEGRLDGAVLYRHDAQGGLFELRVRGQAEEASTQCRRAADCDDADPCSEDICETGRCSHKPKPEGVACGERDCGVAHSCSAGRCVAVDISAQSDGLPCDDGDPCTADGECRQGLCYASQTPRPIQVRATLPTFGTSASASASDGTVFVLASAQRLDVVTLDAAGEMQLRTRLHEPSVTGARVLDQGRFVLRTTERTFYLLDARNPDAPVLTPLPHVVPTALPHETFPPSLMHFSETGIWVVHKGVLVIPTELQRAPGDGTHYVTVAPVDVTQGLPHALDIPAYRMTVLVDSIAYTEPYATQRIGVLRLNERGELEAHTQSDASERGCGYPRYIDGHGDVFATHADEDDVGYAEVCLWRLSEEHTDGLELLGARLLKEHLHDQAVLLTQDHLYLGFGFRYKRGWLGAFLEHGKIVRYDLAWFTQSNAEFTFREGEQVSQWGNGVGTALEHGYLIGLSDGPSTLLNVEAGDVPVLGAGVGQYEALLSVGNGRMLAAGASHAAVVEARADGQVELAWGPQLIHEARRGASDLDVRVLRHGERSITLAPVYANPKPSQLYYHGFSVDRDGSLHHETAKRAWSSGATVAFARSRLWSRSLNDETRTDILQGFDVAQPEASPLEIPSTVGDFSYSNSPRSLRASVDGQRLLFGSPDAILTVDIDTQAVAPFPLRGVAALPVSSYYDGRSDERFAAEDTRTWLDAGGSVAIFDSLGHHRLGYLALPEAAPDRPVAILWLEDDRALVAYSTEDGSSRLAQLVYRDGTLSLLATLSSKLPVTSAAEVENGRFLLTNANGLELVDLQCWNQGIDKGAR